MRTTLVEYFIKFNGNKSMCIKYGIFALLIMFEVYGFFLQTVSEKLLRCGI